MPASVKRPATAQPKGSRKKARLDSAPVLGAASPAVSTPAQAATAAPSTSTAPAPRARARTHKRLAPLKPATNQTVANRPTGAGLANPTREIRGRNVVFVTRKTGLGAYMKRCKTLLVEEGLAQVTLFGLGAAIPHTLLLLHALLHILPYPRQYVTYELRTSTVECTDEVLGASGMDELERHGIAPIKGKEQPARTLEIFEEEESELRTRHKAGSPLTLLDRPLTKDSQSALEIVIRIGKPSVLKPGDSAPDGTIVPKRKTRPNKRKRAKDRQAVEEANAADASEVAAADTTRASEMASDRRPKQMSRPAAVTTAPQAADFNEEDMMNG